WPDPRRLRCHGDPPVRMVPSSLRTYQDCRKPSKTNPRLTVAQETLARIAASPPANRMPPPPASAMPAGDAQTLRAWLESGMSSPACSSDGGAGDGGGAPVDARPDPFAVPPKCSSGKTWTGGTRESPLMQPGE